jgi:hypothetical protein
MVPRREAYFTVGARVGHTALNCESTRPEIGWRPQAKRRTQNQLVELGNPKDLCPWRLQRGDRKVKGCYRAVRPFGRGG